MRGSTPGGTNSKGARSCPARTARARSRSPLPLPVPVISLRVSGLATSLVSLAWSLLALTILLPLIVGLRLAPCCCLYPQHEHISRVSVLVCLSVFACTPVHSNSPTTSTDSLACIAGALTKQLSDLPLSKTCVALVSDIVIEYTRIPHTSYPRRYRSTLATGQEWADTDSVDDETDVNSADLQGLCGVNWRRCQLELTIFPATSRVFSLKRSLQSWRMRQWICLLSRKRW